MNILNDFDRVPVVLCSAHFEHFWVAAVEHLFSTQHASTLHVVVTIIACLAVRHIPEKSLVDGVKVRLAAVSTCFSFGIRMRHSSNTAYGVRALNGGWSSPQEIEALFLPWPALLNDDRHLHFQFRTSISELFEI